MSAFGNGFIWLMMHQAGLLYEPSRITMAIKGLTPAIIDHRYLWEDVPMSLVPIASLGDHLGHFDLRL